MTDGPPTSSCPTGPTLPGQGKLRVGAGPLRNGVPSPHGFRKMVPAEAASSFLHPTQFHCILDMTFLKNAQIVMKKSRDLIDYIPKGGKTST